MAKHISNQVDASNRRNAGKGNTPGKVKIFKTAARKGKSAR